MLGLRRTTPPREVVAAVRAASAASGSAPERVLAAVELRDGRWVAGTRSAVFLPAASGPATSADAASSGHVEATMRRVGWDEVEHAEWDSDKGVLRVWETTPFGTPLRGTHLPIEDPGKFGQLLRERVSASIVVQRHVPVSGKKGVRIVGRRNPADPSAEVSWSFVIDKGLDPSRPGLVDIAEDALRDLRDELGL